MIFYKKYDIIYIENKDKGNDLDMTGVILFRAQPFHNGHLNMIRKAYCDCVETDSELYIFVGSADKEGTRRNPLPINIRLSLIKGALHESFSADALRHIHIIPLDDLTDESDNSYNWGRYLFIKMFNETHDSDMTIYYSDDPRIMLGWFDEEDRWLLRFKFLDRIDDVSATKVREAFMRDDRETVKLLLPDFVYMHYDIIKMYIDKTI